MQDLYEVVEVEAYKHMLTQSLLKIFYLPVVLQSLAVFEIKPKLSIQISIYILT